MFIERGLDPTGDKTVGLRAVVSSDQIQNTNGARAALPLCRQGRVIEPHNSWARFR